MHRKSTPEAHKTRRWFRPRPLPTIVVGMSILSGLVLLQPLVQGQVAPVAAPAPATPLDQPLSWLQEAKRNYGAVKDYSCTLVSQENVRGKLLEQNVIRMKMKPQPFSVHMKWLAPKQFQGQEVAFVMNKNNNKMRVKSNILKGITGFMSIDPNDPRVLEHSRHNILEAGMGNMIEQMLSGWEGDRKAGKTQVKISEASYNQRHCYCIETVRLERRQDAYCYRNVIYLEKQSKMPIRLENYSWPVPGGSPEGELLEMFSYVNLQFNTGLRDEEFVK